MPVSSKNIALGVAVTGIAAVSLSYYLSKRWNKNGTSQNKSPYFSLPGKNIIVVTSFNEWEDIEELLREQVENEKVVGLDCEWSVGTGHGVALLQLATTCGLCVLVRLCKLTSIPHSLTALLADRSILKVGVACLDDGKKLYKDYGLLVQGCVDLRNLVVRHRPLKDSNGLGLKSLSKRIVGIDLDKDASIRCSDWEAEILSQRQIDYAATDAYVSMAVFCEIVWQKLLQHSAGHPSRDTVYQKAQSMCQGIVDANYRGVRENNVNKVNKNESVSQKNEMKAKSLSRAYSSRKRPLYYNCQLRAPDGQMLCTCDTKKAEWYIHKGLGEKICDDPFTVQLKFEPSGRPLSMKNYYVQEKTNICVVCGRAESYVRKHIIPKEYRKHFPSIMKDHLSHDILLLCTGCHQRSTLYDDALREHFARLCNAPIGSETGVKYKQDPALQQVRSAAKALLRCAEEIPEERRQYLEQIVRDYYGVNELDEEILKDMAGIETKVQKDDFVAHGEKVVAYMVEQGELVEFEKMWRQHFVDKMKPQFLPAMWSVDHNHERLKGISEDLSKLAT